MLRSSSVVLIMLIIISQLLPGCGSSGISGKTDKDSNIISPKVSVYYLHQKKRCPTCKAIGIVSKNTVEKYFAKELQKGEVAFFDINLSDTANAPLCKKFECKWAGLYILSIKNGIETKEDITDVGFIYAVRKPDILEQIIKSKIIINL